MSVMDRNCELLEELQDISDFSAPPRDLAPIVNDLYRRNEEVVTADDLARYGTSRSVRQIVRVLRDSGWLYSLQMNGAWGVATGLPAPHTGDFLVLQARLKVQPDTPACIAGRSAAQIRDWLRRPTAPTIGFAGRGKPPRCLDGYSILRWAPKIPLDTIHDLPVWKPETMVAFMGTHPSKFPWSDISEWLFELCETVEPELVARELEGRPAAAWARTAYLIDRGENPAAAEAVAEAGPSLNNGPYYFGRRSNITDDWLSWLPVWSPDYQIVDFLLERNWVHDPLAT